MEMDDVRREKRGALRVASAILILTMAAACGGSDSTDAGSAGFVGDNSSVTISPTTLTVVQGKSATATLTLVRSAGAAQGATVTFVVPSLTKGLTATFNPPSLPPGVSSTILTIAAASDADIVPSEQPFFVPLVGNDTLGLSGSAPSLTLTVRNGRPGVTVQKAGSGTGTVTSTPAGITCGNACNAQFDALTQITVIAAPSAGSAFASWTGLCTGTSLTCTFTPNDFGNIVTATFTSTTPAIALAVSPSPVAVQAGASATTTVTLTRINGFADPVALAVNAPSGITVTPNPTSVTGTTSALTVSTAASLAAGNYPVTITGTGTGVTQQSATFAVQVTSPASGGATTFNYATCETNQIPVWFAFQNGTGPWTRVTPTNNAFTFTIASAGAIAVATPDGPGVHTMVLYGSAAEIASTAIANPCGGAATGTKRITGTFNAFGDDSVSVVTVVMGGAQFLKPANTSAFTITNAPKGPRDLISARATLNAPGQDRMVLRRGTNYAAGNIPTIDFGINNTTDAFTPAIGGIVIPNLGTDQGESEVSLITVNGPSESYFSYSDVPRPNVGFPFLGLPDAQLLAGDYHHVSVFTTPSGTNGTAYRFIQVIQHSPAVQSISLGPQLGAGVKVTTLGASPYLRLRAQIPTQSTYTAGATADYFQNANSLEILMSAAYAGAATTAWTLDIPDLSGAGYNTAWALANGTGVSWAVNAVSGTILPFIGGTPADAQVLGAGAQDSTATFASSSRRGTFRRPRRM